MYKSRTIVYFDNGYLLLYFLISFFIILFYIWYFLYFLFFFLTTKGGGNSSFQFQKRPIIMDVESCIIFSYIGNGHIEFFYHRIISHGRETHIRSFGTLKCLYTYIKLVLVIFPMMFDFIESESFDSITSIKYIPIRHQG